jgi:hypothetical protein
LSGVAVTYTPAATTIEAQLPRLNGVGDCPLNGNDGWFFDSPTKPTRIDVCPGTCSKLGAGVARVHTGCDPLIGASP